MYEKANLLSSKIDRQNLLSGTKVILQQWNEHSQKRAKKTRVQLRVSFYENLKILEISTSKDHMPRDGILEMTKTS